MRTWIVWMLSLGALCAQDLVGTWQGTATTANGQSARMVIQIARGNGGLEATLNILEGNGRPVSAVSVKQEGSALAIEFVPGRMSYAGRVSGDGKAIEGALTQGPGTLALSLVRATPETAWAIPAPAAGPAAMAENARLVFEVATIKPAAPDAQNSPFRVQPGRMEILNRSLVGLLEEAFGVHPSQVIGAAGWMGSERWDIVGQPAAQGRPNQEQVRKILANLLVERFQLKFHMDERELPAYAIEMGKTGQHKLRASAAQGGLGGGDFRGPGAMFGRNATVANIGEALQMVVLDRPVVDKTGIAGRFDFTLDWRPDEFQYGGRGATLPRAANADALPDLFTAFEEQLGLKLSATRARVPVVVIDGAQRPSGN